MKEMILFKSKTGSRTPKGNATANAMSVLREDLIISIVGEQQEQGYSTRDDNGGAEGRHDPRAVPSLIQT